MRVRNCLFGGALVAAGIAAPADAASVLMDQITGAGSSSNEWTSQIFTDGAGGSYQNGSFDNTATDDFTVVDPGAIVRNIEVVFADSDRSYGANVTAWNVNLYSSTAAAGSSLTGDVFSATLNPFITPLGNNGFGRLRGVIVSFDVNIPLAAGTYWVGVNAEQTYIPNGGPAQLFMPDSGVGSGNAFGANPGGGFGNDYITNGHKNLQYAVTGIVVPMPTTFLMGMAGLGLLVCRRWPANFRRA